MVQAVSGVKIRRRVMAVGYIRDNIVGAHVRKAGSSDEKWYIVPLCETCNALNSDVEIDIGNTPMVEVNP